MRFAAYAGASAALATAVVLRAFHQRPNFYSASVYLAQSQACRMILLNLLMLCVYAFVRALQKLLYGPLRPIEREQLWDRSWYAVTETALAMTTFRDEVGAFFLIMFVALLAGKVWGWISEGRVEILEQQPPANPRLFHSRLIASLLVSELFDLIMLRYCVNTLLYQPRPGMMVMFAFEFAVLFITSTSTAVRYAISLRESLVVKRQTKARLEERREEIRIARQEAERQAGDGASDAAANIPREEDLEESDIDVPGWQEKGRWILFLDLFTDFLKLIVYMMFFTMLLLFHGIPIHIIRDVYLTARSFIKRISDFQKYRNATRDMNAKYPDASAEELERDGTCIICREDMRPWQPPPEPAPGAGVEGRRPNRMPPDERQRPKKLPCGHILHLGCLKSWLERQQVCPTCRTSVLAPNPTVNNRENLPQHLLPGGLENRPVQPQPNPNGVGNPPGNANRNGQVEQGVRARTFNLGPWRLTFAAGNGNQVRGVLNGARGQNPAVPPNNNINNNQMTLQGAMLNAERRMAQEVNSLHVAQAQLNQLRAMQEELARLQQIQRQLIAQRNEQQDLNAPATETARGQPLVPGQLQQQQPLPPSFENLNHAIPQGPTTTLSDPSRVQQAVLSAEPDSQVLGPGHPDLPEGIVLPEGWVLLPLQQNGNETHGGPASTEAESLSGIEVTPQAPFQSSDPSSSQELSHTAPATNGGSGRPHATDANTATLSTAALHAGDTSNVAATNGSSSTPPGESSTSLPDWSQSSDSKPPGLSVGAESSTQPESIISATGGRGSANGRNEPGPEGTASSTNGAHAGSSKGKGRAATVEDAEDVDGVD